MTRRILTLALGTLASVMLGGFGAQATGGSLDEVGRHDLGQRGMNAALAIAEHCAYVGSRVDDPPLVLDIANPAHPQLIGQLVPHPGSTSRELRAAPSAHLLVILHYGLGRPVNQLDFYRWADDCRHPALVGRYDFGRRRPHEFYLWQDSTRPERILLFVTTPTARGRNLEVIDASDPAHPASLAGWDVPPELAAGANLHSIALSEDGRTAYLSLWTGGLLLADASDFASGAARPQLRLLTPVRNALRYPPGNVHSAVPLPGRPLVALTDEQYGGCPYGWARLADVSDAVHPRLVANVQIPENEARHCRTASTATWTTHNPTVTANLALISWYSGGLQMFDVTDPARPAPVAQYRSSGPTPRRQDPQLGPTATMSWSYPVIHEGLIYLTDINQGLLVLRYHGTHEAEITGLAFAEGNSNLTRTRYLPDAIPAPQPAARMETSHAAPSPQPFWRAISMYAILLMAVVGVALVSLTLFIRAARRSQAP